MNQEQKSDEKPSEMALNDKAWGFKVPAEDLEMYHKLPMGLKRQIIETLRASFTALVKHNRGRHLIEQSIKESKKLTKMLTV